MAKQQRQQLVEDLFHTALSLNPARRAAFLNDSCQSDKALLTEVQSLISTFEQTSSLQDLPAYKRAAHLLFEREERSLEGKSLGHYRVLNLIGKGGMGEVYRARDVKLGREVAIKVLPEAFSRDQLKLKRFEQEARILASLAHPNICTLHDIGNQEGIDYLVMEYVKGETLAERLARGRLSVEESLKFAIQIADALDKAHHRRIIHRDIKPKNIIITESDQVKLLDFGLAKLTEKSAFPLGTKESTKEASTLDAGEWAASRVDTVAGTAMGTVAYMSPEQARALDVDGRSDIFSLGVTIYEMVVGRLPFKGGNNADVVAAILEAEPPPLSVLAPETPAELQRIISRALNKDREQRYQTSEEMLADLKAVKGEMEFAARFGLISGGVIAPSTPGSARVLALRYGLILLLAAVLAGGLWWYLAGLLNETADKPAASRFSSLKTEQLSSWKSERGERWLRARFSHDGRLITYSSMSGGWGRIWVKETLPGTEPHLITAWEYTFFTGYRLRDETDNRSSIWSPDDQQIAFISDRENETCIWSIPASGGGATLLKTLEESFPELIYWSKDGGTIYYQSPFDLYALDIASKTTSRITDFERSSRPRYFSISPDESHIAYTDDKDGQVDLWVRLMRGGDPVRVTSDPEEDAYPVWHPDGKRVFYTSNRAGVFEICEAYLDGRPPLQLTTGGSGDRKVSDISADGTRLLQVSSRVEAEIYGVEIDTGKEFDLPHDIGLNLWPDLSPDGQTIAFQHTSPAGNLLSSSIIARPIVAEGKLQLAANGFNLNWSPDGSKIAFLRFSDGRIDIFTVNAGGRDEKQLTTGGILIGGYSILPSNLMVRDYCWSPDSSKIAYASRKSGAANIWAINADGSDDLQITSNSDTDLNFYDLLYSADGTRIAYAAGTRTPLQNGKRVWSLQLAEPGESRIIFQANSLMRLVGWSDSGNDFIIAVHKEHSYFPALPHDVAVLGIGLGGDRREIASFKSTYIATTQLSPDRRTLSFVSDQGGSDNLWVTPVRGRKAKRITANADPKLFLANPVWSPDGKMIYYSKQTRWNLISALVNFD